MVTSTFPTPKSKLWFAFVYKYKWKVGENSVKKLQSTHTEYTHIHWNMKMDTFTYIMNMCMYAYMDG